MEINSSHIIEKIESMRKPLRKTMHPRSRPVTKRKAYNRAIDDVLDYLKSLSQQLTEV